MIDNTKTLVFEIVLLARRDKFPVFGVDGPFSGTDVGDGRHAERRYIKTRRCITGRTGGTRWTRRTRRTYRPSGTIDTLRTLLAIASGRTSWTGFTFPPVLATQTGRTGGTGGARDAFLTEQAGRTRNILDRNAIFSFGPSDTSGSSWSRLTILAVLPGFSDGAGSARGTCGSDKAACTDGDFYSLWTSGTDMTL